MLSESSKKLYKEASERILDIQAQGLSQREKDALILPELQKALEESGKLFIVGGVPVHVAADGRMIPMVPKTAAMDEFLIACGIMPESGTIDKALFRFLLAGSYPENELITLSRYLPDEHVLLVNLGDGRYLRFDSEGAPSIHVNGEGGFLFAKGEAAHVADLDAIRNYEGGVLGWDENSPLVRYVLGIGIFGKTSGVGRQVAISVILAWVLAGFFPERVKTQPLLHLHGLGGTRKTAIATALGWVISLLGMSFSVVAAPEDREQMAITLINSKGLICLDEANNLRSLFSLLKAIVTNATLERRVLYTTATVQRFVIKLLCVITTNTTEWTDEAIARRVLKLDMGDPRGQEVVYRGDGAVQREWREKNLTATCWTDLMCRISAAMRLLGAARGKGEDEPTVRYRMSGFWSFVMAIAKEESAEVFDEMTAAAEEIDQEQSRSVNTADDLLPLILAWLKKHPETQRVELTASEIGSELLMLARKGSIVGIPVEISGLGLSQGMTKILSSSLLLSNKLTSTTSYGRLLGMEVINGKRTKKFVFDLSKVALEDQES